MRKNSVKNTRINAEVQRELSRIISREIKDPRINPMTSVVEAVVTPDLKYCKAYISVLGDQDSVNSTLEGLNSAMGLSEENLHIPLISEIHLRSHLSWISRSNTV